MRTSSYTIERLEHGWLLCASGLGMPIGSFGEATRAFPAGSFIQSGIAHHYKVSGDYTVRIAVCLEGDYEKWRSEIEASIALLPPQERWWKGCDVGLSSAAIFGVLADPPWKHAAADFARGSTPSDASDFGRCLRLIQVFPEWRDRLAEVSAVYPAWARIVERWDEIEKATPQLQRDILGSL